MDWDLGVVGFMVLGAMAMGVGLVAQPLAGVSARNSLWLSVAAVYFVIGVVIGESWFGWATFHELSFEDLLLLGLAPIPAVVLVARSLNNRGAGGSLRLVSRLAVHAIRGRGRSEPASDVPAASRPGGSTQDDR